MVMDRAAATAYLGMTNVFALLRLLPVSSQDKDAEILALRHQLSVLQRQLGPGRVRFTPTDRALLAALLHWLPRPRAPGRAGQPAAARRQARLVRARRLLGPAGRPPRRRRRPRAGTINR
jgi:hypothetical protein